MRADLAVGPCRARHRRRGAGALRRGPPSTRSSAGRSPAPAAEVQRWLHQARSFAALPEPPVDGRLRADWDAGFDYADPYGADQAPDEEAVTVPVDFDQGLTEELQGAAALAPRRPRDGSSASACSARRRIW
ncbi:MAG: hypothetical protein R3F59_38210 [Myxococcota bacterium]